MVLSRCLLAGTVAFLLPFVYARAETNVNFNFEPNDQGWTTQTIGAVEQPWTYSNTAPNKGWQAFRGADGAQSGSYLVSPLLYLDPPVAQNQKYVAVRIKHFFDFGAEADPWSLGQVQYSYAGGPWEGIRTADFDSTTSEHYAPTYANPPFPFISLTNIPVASTPVDAWAGATNGFDDRTHRDSYFRLNYGASFTDPYPFVEGQTIQFRLLAGTLDPLVLSGSPQLIWEVTAVEVIHAAIVPEPATTGMAVTGAVMAIISLRRRMRHLPRMI